jgi:UDP-GlcNAc:undecaprenyl-phosphate GlcNAc-1-phosphate transferase
MAVALGGACFGFLYYNFNPARIFMGDAGSLFLGFMLAVLGLKIKMNFFQNLHAVNFFVPIVVLGIPIFDTTLVTVSRLRRRVPIGRGGRDHTSHRLILLGLTVREAVMAVYLVAGALGLAGILLTVANFESGMTLVALLIAGGTWAGYKLEQVYRRQAAGDRRQATGGRRQAAAVSGQPLAGGDQQPAAGNQSSMATATTRSQREADS